MAPKVTKLFIVGLEFLTHALVSPLVQHLWPKDGRTCIHVSLDKKKKKHRQEAPDVSSVAGLQRIFTWSGIQTA
jgi:hypothetical protein